MALGADIDRTDGAGGDARGQMTVRKLLVSMVLLAGATWAMMGRSSHEPLGSAGMPQSAPIEMTAGGFSVRKLVVAKPGTMRLEAVNRDGAPRAMTLSGPGVDVSTAPILPGKSAVVEARLRPGLYRVSSGGGAGVEVAVGGSGAPKR
jgi:hypothetical protein